MRGKFNHMKVYENVIVLTAEFAPFKSKRNGRLALKLMQWSTSSNLPGPEISLEVQTSQIAKE